MLFLVITGTIVYVQEIIQAEKYVNRIILEVLNFSVWNVKHSFLWLWCLCWCEAMVICRVSHHSGPWLILQLSNHRPAWSVSVLFYYTFRMSILHQQCRLRSTLHYNSLYIVKQRLSPLPSALSIFSKFWHFDININSKATCQILNLSLFLSLEQINLGRVASYKVIFCINQS